MLHQIKVQQFYATFSHFAIIPVGICEGHLLKYKSVFLYPATKVVRGIMLYLSVSVRPSVLTISDR